MGMAHAVVVLRQRVSVRVVGRRGAQLGDVRDRNRHNGREALMRFSLIRQQCGDGVVTLAPVGEVDMGAVDALGSALQDALSAGRVDVVVDLAGVTFLDCAGIGALVAGRNTAVRRGCGYTVVNSKWQVRRVLELTGVLTALTGRPRPAPMIDPAERARQSGRHRDDRRAAAGSPAPSAAGVFAYRTNWSW